MLREILTPSMKLIYKLLINIHKQLMSWPVKKLTKSQTALQLWQKLSMRLTMISIGVMKSSQRLPSKIRVFKTVILSFKRNMRSKREKSRRQIRFWAIWPRIPLLTALHLTKLQPIQTTISNNNSSNTTSNKMLLKLHSQSQASEAAERVYRQRALFRQIMKV